jgi:SEC-C motif domain protein
MQKCPCLSEKPFDLCCEPFLTGSQVPPTAEALMRSRYTAFTQKKIHYLIDTVHPLEREGVDRDSLKEWAEQAEWLGLEVHETSQGQISDTEGEVFFTARYKINQRTCDHREKAQFKKEDQRWYFVDGEIQKAGTRVREEKKIGRNDACPCGSTKKYKKCCATLTA